MELPNTEDHIQRLQHAHESLREHLSFADGKINCKSNVIHATVAAQVAKQEALKQCLELYQVTLNMLKERCADLQKRAEESEALAARQQEELGDLHRQITELQSLGTRVRGIQSKLLQEELSLAWTAVFTQGRTDLNFPTHLMSIIIQLKPAADQGRLDAIDAVAILPDDPKIQKTKAYQKGYIIPDSSVTANLPIGDNRWWEEFHQRYEAAAIQKAKWELKDKEKEEAEQFAAKMRAAEQKKAEAKKKAKEMKKKAASAEAKKQTEKQWREAEAEEEDEEDEEDDDEGEPHGRRSIKHFKWMPSEDDSRQQSEEDEASNAKLLNAFYYLGAKCCAQMATNKKWTSCHWCKGRKQGCSALATFPEIRTSKGKLLHAAASWQDNARATTVPKAKQPVRSKSVSGLDHVLTFADSSHSEVVAKCPELTLLPPRTFICVRQGAPKAKRAKRKGKETRKSPDAMDEDTPSNVEEPKDEIAPRPYKGKVIRSPSSSPAPSVTQVDLIETCTTALVDRLATQLAEIQAWDTALKEIDAVADAEDLKWDRQLANMDEELRASHARHGALKARLAELEQQRAQMSADIAEAQRLLTIHQPVSAGMSQFLKFGSTIGGPGGIPQSVLGGQVGPSH
ncbi:hypothetical protein HYDPIDRAFT_33084 [Hydnomerulius pinastri MD-312]|uniref:Uncharacterized protein n=1 Tax=Hydnomerulius pinastri MD-312 TaxID=994086 RepID=A0A0C9V2R4_9AGAM|nr:hypothetical protein HYDPIDRAFT_33084 [Hydnomerulius pinastri MD-312]